MPGHLHLTWQVLLHYVLRAAVMAQAVNVHVCLAPPHIPLGKQLFQGLCLGNEGLS